MPAITSTESGMSASDLTDFETWRQHKATDIMPLLEDMLAQTRSIRGSFLKVRKTHPSSRYRQGRSRLLAAAVRQEDSRRFNSEATAEVTEKLGHLFALIKKYRSEFDRPDSSFTTLIERDDPALTQLTKSLYRVQSCLRSFAERFNDENSVSGWPLPIVPRDQFENTMGVFHEGIDIMSDFLDTLDILEDRTPEMESPPSPHILRGSSTWPALQDYTTQSPAVDIGPWLVSLPLDNQTENKPLDQGPVVENKPKADAKTTAGDTPKKRLVFLATRRLNQSEISKRVDEQIEEEQGHTSIDDYLIMQRQNPVDTFSHWAVYVWDKGDAFSGTLFELGQTGSTSEPFQRSGSILRKKVDGNLRWSLRADSVRQTLLTDEVIFDFAKAVIAKYGENYDFASANCQVFANTLTQCIARPMRREHVFQGIALLPRARAGSIFKRRCQEWEDVKTEFGSSTMLFIDPPSPLAVDLFLNVTVPPLLALLSLLALIEYIFGTAIWRLLVLTLAIGCLLPYARGPVRFYWCRVQDIKKAWQTVRDPILRKQEAARAQEDFIKDTITKDVKDINIGDIQSTFAASRQTQPLFRT